MIFLNKNENIRLAEWNELLVELKLDDKLRKAKSVVIKPNFAAGTYVDPKTHVISNIAFLKNVIESIHEINKTAMIYVAEADSTGYGFAYLKFEHLELPGSIGLDPEVIESVRLLDMSRDILIRSENGNFRYFKNIDNQLWLSKTLLEADFVISLSNLKTHSVTGYTGACKNLFGCLPDTEKCRFHPYIHKVIHDLVLTINPDLNIVDAFYGMEKNGPVQGIDINSGYRVFSDNALEADIYSASTIGYNPKKVKYLKLLSKTNKVDCKKTAETVVKFKKPGLFLRMMNSVGLFVQRCGHAIENFGHRIHSCPSLWILLITIFRPLLLKIFNYEKLKSWKRKISKK